MSTVLNVRNLSVRAKDDGSLLAQNVGFALERGKTLALLGESGCGKTTVCKAVMNLLDPGRFQVSGEVSLDETDLLRLGEREMQAVRGGRIALIVQNPMSAFNPSRKIGAQMAETLRVHTKLGEKALYRLALRALEQMNLDSPARLMESRPYTLSGGMLQRIVIALAIALEPDVILADEATTALDVVNQNIVLDELAKMKARGMAILLVTHDFGVAAKLADEVCVMKNGEIIERGRTKKILLGPAHPYTRAFISASLLEKEASL